MMMMMVMMMMMMFMMMMMMFLLMKQDDRIPHELQRMNMLAGSPQASLDREARWLTRSHTSMSKSGSSIHVLSQ